MRDLDPPAHTLCWFVSDGQRITFTAADALHSCVTAIGISAGPPTDAARLDRDVRQNVCYARRYRPELDDHSIGQLAPARGY